MLKIVVETFPEFNTTGVADNCEHFVGSINRLACGWREIAVNVPDGKEDDDVEPWLRDVNKVGVPCS
jgi:ethanolaminephosphotransferase